MVSFKVCYSLVLLFTVLAVPQPDPEDLHIHLHGLDKALSAAGEGGRGQEESEKINISDEAPKNRLFPGGNSGYSRYGSYGGYYGKIEYPGYGRLSESWGDDTAPCEFVDHSYTKDKCKITKEGKDGYGLKKCKKKLIKMFEKNCDLSKLEVPGKFEYCQKGDKVQCCFESRDPDISAYPDMCNEGALSTGRHDYELYWYHDQGKCNSKSVDEEICQFGAPYYKTEWIYEKHSKKCEKHKFGKCGDIHDPGLGFSTWKKCDKTCNGGGGGTKCLRCLKPCCKGTSNKFHDKTSSCDIFDENYKKWKLKKCCKKNAALSVLNAYKIYDSLCSEKTRKKQRPKGRKKRSKPKQKKK